MRHETWSPAEMSVARRRAWSVVADCSTPALQPQGSTFAFSCVAVHEKLRKSVYICKSYSEKSVTPFYADTAYMNRVLVHVRVGLIGYSRPISGGSTWQAYAPPTERNCPPVPHFLGNVMLCLNNASHSGSHPQVSLFYVAPPAVVHYFNCVLFAVEYLLSPAADVCHELSDLVKAFQR